MMLDFFHEQLNLWNTSVSIVIFTIFFILFDEYVAKPYRRRQMEKRAKHDPEVREALRISDDVKEKVRQGKLMG